MEEGGKKGREEKDCLQPYDTVLPQASVFSIVLWQELVLQPELRLFSKLGLHTA